MNKLENRTSAAKYLVSKYSHNRLETKFDERNGGFYVVSKVDLGPKETALKIPREMVLDVCKLHNFLDTLYRWELSV